MRYGSRHLGANLLELPSQIQKLQWSRLLLFSER
jgi:hypothetical protein